MRRNWRILRWLGLALGLLALLAAPFVYRSWRERLRNGRLQQAEAALAEQRFDTANQLATSVLQESPTEVRALLIAARCAAAVWDQEAVVAWCDRIPADDKEALSQELYLAGERLVREGQARLAEECLRVSWQLDPERLKAGYILAFVLGATGRSWEAAAVVRPLVEQGQYDLPQLLLLGATDEFIIDQQQFLQLCRQSAPDDPLPMLGIARSALLKQDTATARTYLQLAIDTAPRLVEAQVRWGRLLVEDGDEQALERWRTSLPPAVDEHPEMWIVRGLWSKARQQFAPAIRCFLEAARRDPNHPLAHFELGQLLAATPHDQLAIRFQERAANLAQLAIPMKTFQKQPESGTAERIVQLLEQLGRPREALAWTELWLRTHPQSGWARDRATQFQAQSPEQIPWLRDDARLVTPELLASFPLPDWNAAESKIETGPDQPVTPQGLAPALHFTNDADQLGVRFRFENDAATPDNPLRMFELSGGGLGVIDYDADGWPDLYATQGGHFPQEPEPARAVDRCFRNTGDHRFEDVTRAARLGDSRYSQGIAVGDYDQDGFSDLYLANIGCNRLYRNNGDGTFTDITESAQLSDADWTSSCLLADLNGDTLPDLFAVNYLTDDDVYTRVCGTSEHPRQCLPAAFAPCQDRVWLNQGQGEFVEQTDASLLPEQTAGRGLGLLAFRTASSSGLSLLIANDTDPNFWYVSDATNDTSQTPVASRLNWHEQGVASGLAFNGAGIPQASMGIAAGDVDRDGRLDLCVTNFYREGSTLEVQQSDGIFTDATATFGLREPSQQQLGFGAQFLDADSDGWLDLIVANGHVYNNTHLNEPWKMPTQVFWNRGDGHFAELPSDNLGSYFTGRYLGRAVVRWDWNRDGRPDVAVTHADAPLAILTNQTQNRHHRLVLDLRGVHCDRDAVGTIVHIIAGQVHWTLQRVAGDGFQASNDRRLQVGLGNIEQIDEIVIDWPNQASQRLTDVAVDQELLIVEGREPLVVRTFRAE